MKTLLFGVAGIASPGVGVLLVTVWAHDSIVIDRDFDCVDEAVEAKLATWRSVPVAVPTCDLGRTVHLLPEFPVRPERGPPSRSIMTYVGPIPSGADEWRLRFVRRDYPDVVDACGIALRDGIPYSVNRWAVWRGWQGGARGEPGDAMMLVGLSLTFLGAAAAAANASGRRPVRRTRRAGPFSAK